MATGYGTFRVGAATFPLISGPLATNPPLQDADPTLYYGLDFWAAMIRQHVGARLLAIVAGLQMSPWLNSNGQPDVVRQQYPYDVGPYLTELQAQMPLLAAWRGKTQYQKKTASYYEDRCEFTLAYILPPLTAAQAEQIIPVLRAAEAALRNRTVQAWDPSYAPPGGALGQQFDGPDFANVDEIGFVEGYQGGMPASGNLFFPAITMHGFVTERDNAVHGQFPPFAGGDITENLVADDLTTVPTIVQASTQQAPTITGLSVTSGPIAGGTAVTVTGTLFLQKPGPPLVVFGVTPATSVVWVSSTTLTCVTPAVSGPGTLGVSLVNGDSQTATLPNAFTFS
jgi:hypothetical protein